MLTVTAGAVLQVGEPSFESLLPRRAAVVGDSLYFAREVYQRGNDELWRTDGTADGTLRVSPFLGNQFANASHFTNFNGTLYFIASNDAYGVGLWKSDGTQAGTQEVKKFTGTLPNTPTSLELVASENALFLSVSTAAGGDGGTWRSDGTTAGTVRLTTTVGDDLTLSGGSLYFLDGGISTNGLWRSNGTAATTTALNTFAESDLEATAEGTLYFTGTQSGAVGLYATDGTTAGTLLKPFPTGNSFSASITLKAVGDTVFFEISDPSTGTELWRSDGTVNGTAIVKDIRPGTASSSPSSFTVVGDTLYFVATDGVTGRELWNTDGTADGTVLVKDAVPGNTGPTFANFTAVGDALYYSAADAATGRELWRSDGTELGTARLHDFYPGAAGSTPSVLVPFDGALFYQTTDAVGGYGLFRQAIADAATSPSPVLVNDFVDGVMSPSLQSVATSNGRFYFVAGDGSIVGRELFATDGSIGTVALVNDVFPGAINSAPQSFAAVGDTVFFNAEGQNIGRELFKSDGTSAGTVLVKNLYPSSSNVDQNDGDPTGLIAYNGAVYFSGFDETRAYRFWKSNGTAAGTVVLTDSSGSKIRGLSRSNLAVVHNGLLYFASSNGLLRTDGTSVSSAAGNPSSSLASAAGALYFAASSTSFDGEEPWRSDGISGAIRLRDINPSTTIPGGSRPTSFTGFGKQVFFVAYDPAIGRELWKTDGTEAGTVLVTDIRLPANDPQVSPNLILGSDPSGLANINGRMVFFADDGVHGRELWVSNGTADGTVMLKDINPGAASSGGGMIVIGRRGYFTADDGASGEELWTTDGTAAGTFRVADINPGPDSSSPRNLTVVNGVLTFTANDGTDGVRLYTAELPAPASQVAGRHVFYNNSFFDGNSAAANSSDDSAIATDKRPLLPGGTATFANYTSFSKGLNGVMIDVSRDPGGAAISATNFRFTTGNSTTPGAWLDGPTPTMTVRVGDGIGGTDRITFTWADGAIAKQWLELTALSDTHGGTLGLAADDVFYFGNALGESGDNAANAIVNSTDEVGARNNPRTMFNRAPIDFRWDYNRDGVVNSTDQIIARNNGTTFLTALKLITAPQVAEPVLAVATAAEITAADDAVGGWAAVSRFAGSTTSPRWYAVVGHDLFSRLKIPPIWSEGLERVHNDDSRAAGHRSDALAVGWWSRYIARA